MVFIMYPQRSSSQIDQNMSFWAYFALHSVFTPLLTYFVQNDDVTHANKCIIYPLPMALAIDQVLIISGSPGKKLEEI